VGWRADAWLYVCCEQTPISDNYHSAPYGIVNHPGAMSRYCLCMLVGGETCDNKEVPSGERQAIASWELRAPGCEMCGGNGGDQRQFIGLILADAERSGF
jgi:hypothetical protein